MKLINLSKLVNSFSSILKSNTNDNSIEPNVSTQKNNISHIDNKTINPVFLTKENKIRLEKIEEFKKNNPDKPIPYSLQSRLERLKNKPKAKI